MRARLLPELGGVAALLKDHFEAKVGAFFEIIQWSQFCVVLTLCFVCSLLLNTISSTTQLVREWFDPGLSMAWVVVFVMPC